MKKYTHTRLYKITMWEWGCWIPSNEDFPPLHEVIVQTTKGPRKVYLVWRIGRNKQRSIWTILDEAEVGLWLWWKDNHPETFRRMFEIEVLRLRLHYSRFPVSIGGADFGDKPLPRFPKDIPPGDDIRQAKNLEDTNEEITQH